MFDYRTKKSRRLSRLFGVDLLGAPIDLDLTMEEIMADLEPSWVEWEQDSATESQSAFAA